jgi:hypothetical protein
MTLGPLTTTLVEMNQLYAAYCQAFVTQPVNDAEADKRWEAYLEYSRRYAHERGGHTG